MFYKGLGCQHFDLSQKQTPSTQLLFIYYSAFKSTGTNKEQAASAFHLFAAPLGLFLVISSSIEVPIFIPNAVTTSHDKTPCYNHYFYLYSAVKQTINDLNVLLTCDTKLLISLRMLYKRPLMKFQWLLPEIKPQMHSAIFNFDYYLI